MPRSPAFLDCSAVIYIKKWTVKSISHEPVDLAREQGSKLGTSVLCLVKKSTTTHYGLMVSFLPDSLIGSQGKLSKWPMFTLVSGVWWWLQPLVWWDGPLAHFKGCIGLFEAGSRENFQNLPSLAPVVFCNPPCVFLLLTHRHNLARRGWRFSDKPVVCR